MFGRERANPSLRSISGLYRLGAAAGLALLMTGCSAVRSSTDYGIVIAEDPNHQAAGPNSAPLKGYLLSVNFRKEGAKSFIGYENTDLYDQQFNPGDCVRLQLNVKTMFMPWQQSEPAYDTAAARIRKLRQIGTYSLDRQGTGDTSITLNKAASTSCNKKD